MAKHDSNSNGHHKRVAYDLAEMEAVFGIVKQRHCEQLDAWLRTGFDLTDEETRRLERFHQRNSHKLDDWNEEEVKIKGVGLLFDLADTEAADLVEVFYERLLKAVINNYQLSVVADCVVATPSSFNTPRTPFFFLQEFKKSKGEKNDPEAQMLQAMLIAGEQNGDGKPLYGSFVIGSNWFFTTLIGRIYCASRKHDATDLDDLRRIVFALRELKNLIVNR
jgi:hypothetical protein